jgi:hypothetical protein
MLQRQFIVRLGLHGEIRMKVSVGNGILKCFAATLPRPDERRCTAAIPLQMFDFFNKYRSRPSRASHPMSRSPYFASPGGSGGGGGIRSAL